MERPRRVSVVVTVLNEAHRLPDLLESLAAQEPPYEVLVVDAGSRDGSQELVRDFAQEHPDFRLLKAPGSRGHSRNEGARRAEGDALAFIDGDCLANPFWLRRLREPADERTVVAGRTVLFGYWAFERLQRVELEHRGQDVTYPSCNLLYPRRAFLDLGGFDDRFVTAEDIDLNFRAVEAGLGIRYASNAVVYHRARDSVASFLKQAFWNGYGRKQLTLKHGELWSQYALHDLVRTQFTFWGLLRMTSATLGYLRCKFRETPTQWHASPGPALHEARAREG